MESRPCKSCGMPLLMLTNADTGKVVPLYAEKVPIYEILSEADGTVHQIDTAYISHFLNCPNAGAHSKSKPKPAASTAPAEPKSGETIMFFGKYKDKPLTEIPSKVLDWYLENVRWLKPEFKEEIRRVLNKREQEESNG